jgi:carboxypeptidase Taq
MQNSILNFNDYKNYLIKIADLNGAAALLQWDQETYMPLKSANTRAQQLATLSETAHIWATDKDWVTGLKNLAAQHTLEVWEKQNVYVTLQELERKLKLTPPFVANLSRASSMAFNAWQEAKQQNNFGLFQKELENLVNLKIEEAHLIGFDDHPYNALLDEYDPGSTTKDLDNLFKNLLPELQLLVNQLSKKEVSNDFLHLHYPKDQQWNYTLQLLKSIGFNFDKGRQDISSHPFSINFSSEDVRITTRIDEQDFSNATWSCLHEAGHALYEQGLAIEYYGLPVSTYSTLSIHESQSRFWENCIGRSSAFWNYHYKDLQEKFPKQLGNTDLDKFILAINKVTPSFIRTEADELTYHFHVYIRYEIEKELLNKQLQVKDIPERWNELYEKYLGIKVPNLSEGCLQDVHWSHGSFGYFPTYSLGSLAAAQLWNTIQRKHANVVQEIEHGNYANIHSWMKENIYNKGRLYYTNDLLLNATNEPLNTKYFIAYIKNKFEIQ